MIKVIEYITITKRGNWWTAVVLVGEKGHKKVILYRWNKRGDKWKRLQKFTIGQKRNWPLYKDAIEKLLDKID
jgi:hypothetical protein